MSEPCAECGGDCAPECGRHPAGCVYGGWTEASSYWLAVEGYERNHEGPLPPLTAVLEGET